MEIASALCGVVAGVVVGLPALLVFIAAPEWEHNKRIAYPLWAFNVILGAVCIFVSAAFFGWGAIALDAAVVAVAALSWWYTAKKLSPGSNYGRGVPSQPMQ